MVRVTVRRKSNPSSPPPVFVNADANATANLGISIGRLGKDSITGYVGLPTQNLVVNATKVAIKEERGESQARTSSRRRGKAQAYRPTQTWVTCVYDAHGNAFEIDTDPLVNSISQLHVLEETLNLAKNSSDFGDAYLGASSGPPDRAKPPQTGPRQALVCSKVDLFFKSRNGNPELSGGVGPSSPSAEGASVDTSLRSSAPTTLIGSWKGKALRSVRRSAVPESSMADAERFTEDQSSDPPLVQSTPKAKLRPSSSRAAVRRDTGDWHASSSGRKSAPLPKQAAAKLPVPPSHRPSLPSWTGQPRAAVTRLTPSLFWNVNPQAWPLSRLEDDIPARRRPASALASSAAARKSESGTLVSNFALWQSFHQIGMPSHEEEGEEDGDLSKMRAGRARPQSAMAKLLSSGRAVAGAQDAAKRRARASADAAQAGRGDSAGDAVTCIADRAQGGHVAVSEEEREGAAACSVDPVTAAAASDRGGRSRSRSRSGSIVYDAKWTRRESDNGLPASTWDLIHSSYGLAYEDFISPPQPGPKPEWTEPIRGLKNGVKGSSRYQPPRHGNDMHVPSARLVQAGRGVRGPGVVGPGPAERGHGGASYDSRGMVPNRREMELLRRGTANRPQTAAKYT